MEIRDLFETGPAPAWVRFAVGHANIEHAPGIARLVVDGAEHGKLSDAEIDDHRTAPRHKLPWKPPLKLTVRARFSHASGQLYGTAGFGFWNDPFDWVGNVEVPPSSIWFFYASPHSDMSFVRGVRGSGWKAAMLNGGRMNRLMMWAGNLVFRLPGTSKLVFAAAEQQMRAAETLLDEVSMTEWHMYELQWGAREAVFAVDGKEWARMNRPPTVPLGFVAWVDNNSTAMGPGRDFRFDRIPIPQRQWMELAEIAIQV